MKTWQIVLLSVSLPLVLIYAITTCVFAVEQRKHIVCKDYTITIKDSVERPYVTSLQLQKLLKKDKLIPLDKAYGSISTAAIEQCIAQNDFVKSVDCYKTNNGVLKIKVTQREPVLHVLTDTANYFVDTEREIMPVTTTTASYVPIITGRVQEERAKGDLFDFVSFLSNDSYWDAQIVQIDVLPNQEIQLVPRVGNHTILLGELDNYEVKLKRLKTFYKEGLNKIGWQTYRQLDLRYDNQVVAKK